MDDSYEATTHSFLLRVWLEEYAVEDRKWRGHITHVSDGTRHYIDTLEGINVFISNYLADMGVVTPSSESSGNGI